MAIPSICQYELAPSRAAQLPVALNLPTLAAFCTVLFLMSLRNIKHKWIY